MSTPPATKAAVEARGPQVPQAWVRPAQRRLCLLAGPYVVHDHVRLSVPEGSKRLLVFVALRDGHVDRRQTAGTLWPVGDDERAAGNLRTALWRLKSAGIDDLRSDKCDLWLDPASELDLREVEDWAAKLIRGPQGHEDLHLPAWGEDALDLLPGWYDEWIIFERERLRQRVLHALDSLSTHLTKAGRFAEAIDAALIAVRVEPLRESAQRTLIQAHLAEGNRGEARRAFEEYRVLINKELGEDPLPELAALVSAGSSQGSLSRARAL